MTDLPIQDLELLTAAEAGALMKVDASSVYRLMREGEIAVVKFRRSVRIRRRDLERFIDDHTKPEAQQ